MLDLTLLKRNLVTSRHADDAERSRLRYQRALLSALTMAFTRGANLVSMLVMVPLALHYLGAEEFGVFATVLALIAMLGFADLGLGNGLLNAVASASGRDDVRAIRKQVATAFVLLTALAAALGLSFVAIYPHVEWAALLSASHIRGADAVGPALAVVVACMLINLPIGIVQRVQVGLQEGFRANAWAALGAPFGLILVVVAIHLSLGLEWLVGAVCGGLLLASALNAGWFFLFRRRDLVPRLHEFDATLAKRLLFSGCAFFVLQLGVVVTFQTDALVLSHILGPAAVTEYSVPLRLFLFVPLLVGLCVTPLWPAYGEALARDDLAWARSALAKSIRLALWVSILLSGSLALLVRPILRLWVGGTVHPSSSLVVAAALFAVVVAVSSALSIFLNGAGHLRSQAIFTVITIVVNLILSIVLTQRFGVSGVLWATVVSQSCCFLIPASVIVRRRLNMHDRAARAGVPVERPDLPAITMEGSAS